MKQLSIDQLREGMVTNIPGVKNKIGLITYIEPSSQARWIGEDNHIYTDADFGSVTAYPKIDTAVWRKRVVENKDYGSYMFYSGQHAITVGSDPEIFVLDGNGDILPAFAYLPSKSARNYTTHSSQFYDGFQAEWTTESSYCNGLHEDRVREGMQAVLAAARKVDPKAKLTLASVVPIPSKIAKRVDPQYFQLGCSPSENVYGEEQIRPVRPEEIPYRSAGWHMHIGVGVNTKKILPKEKIHAAVRMMDKVLGVALVGMGRSYRYPQRRELYGRAGEYRYGKTLEYRVPEVILGAHPATWNLMWDIGRTACYLGLRGFEFLWDAENDEVRDVINNSDVRSATRIIKRNEGMFKRIVEHSYGVHGNNIHALGVVYEGIEYAVKNPENVEGNWRLNEDWSTEAEGHADGTTWGSTVRLLAKGKLV